MRILLTGASGFVGLNIAQALCERGDALVLYAADPLPTPARDLLLAAPVPPRFIAGDIRDTENLGAAARGCEAVVHGAAITPGGPRELASAARALEINAIGTVNALDAAGRAGAGRFLFLGSAAVYGAHAAVAPLLDEDATPALPETVYATTKFAAERLSLRLGRQRSLDVRCVRLGSVFGPWERDSGVRDTLSAIHQVTMAAIAGRDAVLPRPGRRDWIYARDAAAAVLAVLDAPTPPTGIVNIGLGAQWTVEAWCRLLQDRFAGFRYVLADGRRAPTIDFHGDVDRSPLAVRRLTDEVGFRPRFGLREAFDDYLAWLGAHGGSSNEQS